MKKTLPYYMMLALYKQFDMKGLQSEVKVNNSVMGWVMFTLLLPSIAPKRISHIIRFQSMLEFFPAALRKWAEEDPDIKSILVEVEL